MKHARQRPYRLVWMDSCRHTRSFSTYDRAYVAARAAKPCRGRRPCVWIIEHNGTTLIGGAA